MKRFTYVFSLTLTAFILAAAVIIGCEGPAGPQGPAGKDGTNGVDGKDGVDANATCTQCHNDDTEILAKSLQWEASGHLLGGHYRYGDRTTCSVCHTHEGFLDRMASGELEASTAFIDATPPNCRTCHNVHKNYDPTDFALRFTDPVTLWINDAVVDMGDNNLCVNCHQVRMPWEPLPEVGGADIVLDGGSWGPHQAQGPMVWGTAGYEVTGSSSYPTPGSTGHAGGGCIACHMVEPPRGNQAGGHTTSMYYESRGTEREFTASCEECHGSDADSFDYLGIQTEVTELLDSLANILHNDSILIDGEINASEEAPLTLTADEAGALMNLFLVEADKSSGVHNPRYIKALLKNSIQAMQ